MNFIGWDCLLLFTFILLFLLSHVVFASRPFRICAYLAFVYLLIFRMLYLSLFFCLLFNKKTHGTHITVISILGKFKISLWPRNLSKQNVSFSFRILNIRLSSEKSNNNINTKNLTFQKINFNVFLTVVTPVSSSLATNYCHLFILILNSNNYNL